ncbi:MAG TPA: hypothetical protein VHS31_01730 [Tepidisphaeraceae bacterium]|nr:hypothetical protein [Tepidisphaeraceae bacterium]
MNPTDLPLLRHTLATLAYRAAKVLRDAPPAFEKQRIAPSTRSAGEILAHICDLLDWAATMTEGKPIWHDSPSAQWNDLVARFFKATQALDHRLAAVSTLPCSAGKIFQGPIADALTHVGQLATLRRLAGAGVLGENYFLAHITSGCVGADQPPAVKEFD